MNWKNLIFVFGLLPIIGLFSAERAWSQTGDEKIESRVLSDIKRDRRATFFIVLGEQADLSGPSAIRDWKGKGEAVVKSLRDTAARSQAPILQILKSHNVQITPYWIVNTIKVTTSDEQLIHRLAALPNVTEIRAEKTWQIPDPIPDATQPTIQSVEWGVARVHAPEVWSQFGATGQGIVVASLDTGVQFNHPALVSQYRGHRPDGTFDHNYNWYDPTGICGSPSQGPCDNNGHGTHTMGIAVGGDGGANQIGVAPGAKWITAKGCEGSTCSSSALLASGQWILAPTDLNGSNPRPDLRPNIVNNSWGGDSTTDGFFRTTIQVWLNAGIFPAFAIGNSGSACGSGITPGAFPEAFGVGATDISDNIAGFSGRGPANGFGGIVKPNVSAPGVGIRSSVPTNGYASLSGTSMATPHAAGVVALLWSANPSLIGNVNATEDLLQRTADFRSSSQCDAGGLPNNVFGWGVINALAAVQGVAPTTHNLTVASANPNSGASVSVSPSDRNGQGGGATQFTRTYNNNAAVTLTASSTAGGNGFSSWTGCDSSFGTTCTVTINFDKTVTANYVNASGPTWPSAPPNLAAQCSTDGTQATLSWSGLNGATAYALRVNYRANDGPGCSDGWYCGDPPDKMLNNYGATSYVASVKPGQPYDFWVHGMQGGSYGSAGSATFTCGAPPPSLNPTWPSAPVNLAAQCSADGTQATLSWSGLNGAAAYALRVNYRGNDGPGCGDGWYCGDPPDKMLNNYGATTYVASVTPGQPYDFWVHGMQGGSYGNAGSASFTCGAQATPNWPSAPVNLVAQCSANGSQATLFWSSVSGATAYALRLNYLGNDSPACAIDGWYCSDPPDKIVNNYGGTSYVANVTPGQPYEFWVHASQGSSYGSAADTRFTCSPGA